MDSGGTLRTTSMTSYCKNSVDGLWYCFDDSDVQQLSEDEVCTQTAYILFLPEADSYSIMVSQQLSGRLHQLLLV